MSRVDPSPGKSLTLVACLLVAALTPLQGSATSAAAIVPKLISIAEARGSLGKTGQGPPQGRIKLGGVVTAFSGWNNSFFLQDATGALSVDRTEQTPVSVGDRIELVGTVQPGRFAPLFLSESLRVVGVGERLKPRNSTYYDLSLGKLDSEWIEVSGIVHSASVAQIWGKRPLLLELRLPGGAITVHVLKFPEANFDQLVGSTVRVRGACGTIFNDHQQFVGVRLFVPSFEDIRVETQAIPFSELPVTALANLLRFNSDVSPEHRVRIAGTVTLQYPGRLLYAQTGNAAVRIETKQTEVFPVGSHIEAYGFIGVQGYSLVLDNAVVRRAGRDTPPLPVPVKADDVIHSDAGFAQAPYDGLLIRIQGRVLERLPNPKTQLWLIEDHNILFQAELAQNSSKNGEIESASLVALTGVCRTRIDDRGLPQSFRVLLRTPNDIEVVRSPYSALSGAFLLLALILILGGLGAFYLQRRNAYRAGQVFVTPLSKSRLKFFARLSRILAVLSTALGLVVLLGWAAHLPLLTQFHPDYSPMEPNAALSLVVLGVSLWLANRPRTSTRVFLQNLCDLGVAVLAGLTLAETLTGWNLHADSFLFPMSGSILADSASGRMSLVAALSFLLLSGALSFTRCRPWSTVLAQTMSLVVGALCLLSLNAFLFGIRHLYGASLYAGMSAHSAAGLLLLSIGVLVRCPGDGVMRSVSSLAPGGTMAARLLPCVLLLPSVIGWLRWEGQVRGLYGTAFGLALLVSTSAICFVFLVWIMASLLNRLDAKRSLAEAETQHFNDTLEARVAQRTLELHESEANFRLIIDAITEYSIVILDPDGLVISWNVGAERQKGYRAEEILDKHFSRFYTPDERLADIPARDLRHAASFGECRREGWRSRRDGSLFLADSIITSVRKENGDLRGFAKITHDITERKFAEEKFRTVFESASHAMIMVGTDGLIKLVNCQGEKLFGYDRQELLGQPIELLVPLQFRGGSQPDLPTNFFWDQAPGPMGKGRDLFGLSKTGEEVPIEVSFNPISTPQGDCVLASIIDVSERRKAEKELADQALIISQANDAIFIRDNEDRITFWNEGAQRLYGWAKAEALGQILHDLLKTQFPQPLMEIHANLASQGYWRGELIHTTRDGSLVVVASTWTVQRGRTDARGSVLETNFDLTETRRIEAALRAARAALELRVAELAATNSELAKKNEEVEAFVYIVSHDLRAPLVNLQGFCKELTLSCDELQVHCSPDRSLRSEARVQEILGSEMPASLHYIHASTSKFHRLINALLELSRYGRQSYSPEELDLGRMLTGTLDSLHRAVTDAGVQISIAQTPKAYGDPMAVEQVFSNLISNAVKYRHADRSGVIEIGGETQGDSVHYWVRDNGVGLPAGAQARLFKMFQRFHLDLAPGEGMGLAIVKRIVERHGGTVWAEGEEGVGSTFHFTLPTKG